MLKRRRKARTVAVAGPRVHACTYRMHTCTTLPALGVACVPCVRACGLVRQHAALRVIAATHLLHDCNLPHDRSQRRVVIHRCTRWDSGLRYTCKAPCGAGSSVFVLHLYCRQYTMQPPAVGQHSQRSPDWQLKPGLIPAVCVCTGWGATIRPPANAHGGALTAQLLVPKGPPTPPPSPAGPGHLSSSSPPSPAWPLRAPAAPWTRG